MGERKDVRVWRGRRRQWTLQRRR
uniref:Uncharacterized protein n=1 Tax=Rhizophora mucronata TaxID=61149 RepID=A0A2P2P8I0_RHIMU